MHNNIINNVIKPTFYWLNAFEWTTKKYHVEYFTCAQYIIVCLYEYKIITLKTFI